MRGYQGQQSFNFSRRDFLLLSAAAGALRLSGVSMAKSEQSKTSLGVYVNLDKNPAETIAKVRELGFDLCEIYSDDFGDELSKNLREALEHHHVKVSALFSMGPGPMVWDFYDGPKTIGLVPREWRKQRLDALKKASDFAAKLNITALETHCGFIPENPNDVLYGETVKALKEIVAYCKSNGQTFLYHAGQETPTTLVRTITDVGLENQGVGLDAANLIMYDKGHPIYSLDVYGGHLKTVNAKDGLYPASPRQLGREVPIGKGCVDFPRFIRKLKGMNYSGPVIIERETSGPQQIADIKASKTLLEKLLNNE